MIWSAIGSKTPYAQLNLLFQKKKKCSTEPAADFVDLLLRLLVDSETWPSKDWTTDIILLYIDKINIHLELYHCMILLMWRSHMYMINLTK